MPSFTTAYSSFSVLDLRSTQAFYGDVLGLPTQERDAMLVLHLPGGAEAVTYPSKAHRPATFTILNFVVPDVPAAVAELRDRGVAFERYEGTPVETDEHGVYRCVGPLFASFKDPPTTCSRCVRATGTSRAAKGTTLLAAELGDLVGRAPRTSG